ncbi:VOC family protein [Amycolatopsis magusensis]|uniref:Glyoxalase-like domain-containing protein n=1 Tax=Amycolatopsis magusensis TaxID=882444 RepID=A0ABS4Q390_9PSEU|nr:VOC family protein [Amycolatopsis magusensis]MBP2186136.1 hypothetical protein [Amycolatopsis magusensis]MDI5977942.1 VOC family protein [Amycolatopsis magusensis]
MGLSAVVFDVARPWAVAGFWSDLVEWQIMADGPGRVEVFSKDFTLAFEESPVPKTVKNRIHLDLASPSAAVQKSIVDRALSLGATRADIGQRGELPWEVLADPAGNEFCVLEPRPEYTGTFAAVVLDAGPIEPAAFDRLGEFWSATTGWPIHRRHPVQLGLRAPEGTGPWLEVLLDGDAKQVEDRVRFEVTGPEPGPHQDPEGNDFRVVSPA